VKSHIHHSPPTHRSKQASTSRPGVAGWTKAQIEANRASMRKLARLPEPEEGAGEPLPHLRQMESAFGRPLGDVEAYTGMAAKLRPRGAEALTAGNVVAFADAGTSPATTAGCDSKRSKSRCSRRSDYEA